MIVTLGIPASGEKDMQGPWGEIGRQKEDNTGRYEYCPHGAMVGPPGLVVLVRARGLQKGWLHGWHVEMRGYLTYNQTDSKTDGQIEQALGFASRRPFPRRSPGWMEVPIFPHHPYPYPPSSSNPAVPPIYRFRFPYVCAHTFIQRAHQRKGKYGIRMQARG